MIRIQGVLAESHEGGRLVCTIRVVTSLAALTGLRRRCFVTCAATCRQAERVTRWCVCVLSPATLLSCLPRGYAPQPGAGRRRACGVLTWRCVLAGVRIMSLGVPKIKVGDTFPTDIIVHIGFAGNTPSAPQKTGSLVGDKKCLVVTLPGAFTPT